MNIIRSVSVCALVLLGGCASATIEDYKDNSPVLDIREYFRGDITAHGVFIDRSNKADPSFCVTLKGKWDADNNGTLAEKFIYSDGRKEARVWTLHMIDEHHFTGTAPDVVGIMEGTQYGNAAHLHYVLTINTQEGKTHNIVMNDWLYLTNDNTVINHVLMTKHTIKVGELIITFDKKATPVRSSKHKKSNKAVHPAG